MSKKATYLLGILLTIVIGVFLCCKLCCSSGKKACCKKTTCNKSKQIDTNKTNEASNNSLEVNPATTNPFKLKDGDFVLNSNQNFKFNTSGFKILDSMPQDLQLGVTKLKDYLTNNPLKSLDITGQYKSNETNNSAYPNLGYARANAVKNYFANLGVPSKQINTNGKLNDAMYADKNNVFYGPISYAISTTKEDDTSAIDALKANCNALKNNPLVLYFQTGSNTINLTPEQRQKFVDLRNCADKLDMKILVVGHTDNTGNAENNLVLAENRANSIKNYLIKNGISAATIETSSKGQTEPIADNKTEEGRQKNRRTVVSIN